MILRAVDARCLEYHRAARQPAAEDGEDHVGTEGKDRDRDRCRIRHRPGHRKGPCRRGDEPRAGRPAAGSVGGGASGHRSAGRQGGRRDGRCVRCRVGRGRGASGRTGLRQAACRGEQRRRGDARHARRGCQRRGVELGDRRQRIGRDQRHPHLRADDPSSRRGRPCGEHCLDLRLLHSSGPQPRRVFDDQVRRGRLVRGARAGGRGRRHRCFRAVPGRGGDAHLRVCRDAARAVRRTLCTPATGRDAGATGRGLAPELVGQRVLQAIRQREFYVLTHAGERAAIKARHERIEAAFDRAEAWEKSR